MNARQGFVGQSVERREDARFLTGQGQYTDDITLPGQTYAAFLRSPHAHALIKSIDTTAAAAAPGVVGIFTGEHFKAVGGLPCGWLINSLDGTPMKEPKHPVLADGKARYVGDRVAMVVAETQEQARAAAALIDVDYEVLTPVVDTARAFGAGSAVHDEAPRQPVLPLGHRRQGGHRGRFRAGGAHHDAEVPQQPADPERDRAARGQRQLQRPRRQLHAVRGESESARRAAADVRLRARHPRAQDARRRPRRRRRLRQQDLPVRRRDRDGLGEQATAPPDQVDGRAQRELPVGRAWPRPCQPG